MAIDKTRVDALMFDMDGTLWDAMDSYAEVWNRTFAEYGEEVHITGRDLLHGMGKTLDQIRQLSPFSMRVLTTTGNCSGCMWPMLN